MTIHTTQWVSKYTDYVGAAITIYITQIFHFFNIDLHVSYTMRHNIINVITTVVLAFIGVFAAEMARTLIRILKKYLNKKQK